MSSTQIVCGELQDLRFEDSSNDGGSSPARRSLASPSRRRGAANPTPSRAAKGATPTKRKASVASASSEDMEASPAKRPNTPKGKKKATPTKATLVTTPQKKLGTPCKNPGISPLKRAAILNSAEKTRSAVSSSPGQGSGKGKKGLFPVFQKGAK